MNNNNVAQHQFVNNMTHKIDIRRRFGNPSSLQVILGFDGNYIDNMHRP